ncbi:MAG: hypothetical protein IKB50_00135 [Clostridia bacterium]|nr:hypothetical protein [Clostridia bacterium]
MNKQLYFKICTVTVGIFLIVWITAFSVFFAVREEPAPVQEPTKTEDVSKPVQSATLSHYIARAENGKVAVYEVYSNGFEQAVPVPEINLARLPEQDRKSFNEGVVLNSKRELASLIEDFSS